MGVACDCHNRSTNVHGIVVVGMKCHYTTALYFSASGSRILDSFKQRIHLGVQYPFHPNFHLALVVMRYVFRLDLSYYGY